MRLKTKLAALAAMLIAASLAAQTHPRALTRAEIAAAIQKSLAANDLSTEPPISPSDITIAAPIAVTEAHPILTVAQIESRPGSNTTAIALWTTSEPRIPPFWVTVDRKLESPLLTTKRIGVESSTAFVAPPSRRRRSSTKQNNEGSGAKIADATPAPLNIEAPVLVRAGNPIQLIVQGADMRIMAKAKALETGRVGQQIRVQTEPAGKILVARIVTAKTAEIDY